MDEEELEIALQLALEEMDHTPPDAHEVEFRIKQLLDQMRALGMPLPDDLVELARDLDEKFAAEAGG